MVPMSRVQEAEALFVDLRRDPVRAQADALSFLDEVQHKTEREAEVVIRRGLGWALREVGRHREAAAMLRTAMRTAHALEDPRRIAEVAVTLAGLDIELGRFAQARRRLIDAEVTSPAHIDVLTQRANVEWFDGRLQEADRRYGDLASLVTAQSDAKVQAEHFGNHGVLLTRLGELDRATTAFERCSEVIPPDDVRGLAVLCHNWAEALVLSGRLAEAMELFDEADRRAAEAGMPRVEFLIGRARALVDLRLGADAVEAADAALALAEHEGAAFVRAEAHLLATRARRLVGDVDAASTHARSAALILRRQRRPGGAAIADTLAATTPTALRRAARRLDELGLTIDAAFAYLAAGEQEAANGRTKQAIAAFDRAATARELGPSLAQAGGWLAHARSAELRHDTASAITSAERGLAVLDRYAATLGSQELRARASAHGEALAEVLLRIAVDSQDPASARRVIRRWRARSLGGRPSPDDEVKRLLADLRAAVTQRSTATDPTEIAHHDTEIARIERRVRRRATSIGMTVNDDSGDKSPDYPSILELAVFGDRLIAVADDSIVDVASMSDVLAEMTHLGAALRRLARRPSSSAASHALSAIDDIASAIGDALPNGTGPIAVVPPPSLWTLPWHALGALADRPVIVAPSVRYVRHVESERRRVAAIAGPDLPGVTTECAAVSDHWADAIALSPPDSTVDAATALIAMSDLAHLACHGSFRADNPMFSTLKLADGALTGMDIEQLEDVPQLVVLSACRSALTDAQPADEAIGLLTAFLGNGVRAVVASPWPLPDEAAVAMLVELHRQLAAGEPLSIALHRAREVCDPSDPVQLAVRLSVAAFGSDVSFVPENR
jgi:tetratricopeptide (TPR) repeat protein